MSKFHNKLIDQIFTGALDRSGSERDEFVDEQCGDDTDLKEEVLSLLKASESSDDGLDSQINSIRNRLLRSVFDGDPNAREDLSGQTISNWRIEKKVARGGLATVYLAHRDDGEFDQKAAFKALRRGLDTDDLIARFRAERQILSTLEHPGIAQILDGGALDDGRPYLVLEYVDGLPITDYCVENQLGVREKVVLMLRVLRALHHAHTHLVVHRDIKPSNILVSTGGNVSLLDFGIAKLLDPDAMPGVSTMTRTGMSLLTPGYGSPEQHAGEAVTTASDVYQCGLVLFEMLTGERPYESQPEPGETNPLLPSSALRGKASAKGIRGDLDAIVRKATRGDPEQRYSSATEMESDLQRYLDGLPVIAQPDSVGYRVSKFAKRHPWAVPGIALLVLGVAAYITTITIYSQRLAHEEQLTAASQQFMIDLFRSSDPFAPADPERGSNITVVEALHIGKQRIDEELSDQPELKAALLVTISDVYDSLDQDQESMEMRQEALRLEQQLYGERSPQVIASLHALGNMYRNSGNPEKADQYIERQLELARETFSENSAELGLAELAAGIHASQTGQVARSRRLLVSGIGKLRTERFKYARELIGALIVSAENHGMENNTEAFRAIAEAGEIATEVFGDSSLQAAIVKIRLASSMTMIGSYEESERNFLEALPVLEGQLGKDHSSSLSALNNLGYLYTHNGESEKAVTIFKELLDRQLRLYGPVSRSAADSYQNLASTLASLGLYDEALPMHRKAYDTYKSVLNDDNYLIAFPLLSTAYSQLQLNDGAAAESAAREALQRFQATVPGTFLEGVARCLVGLSLEMQGQTNAGSEMVLESHALMEAGSIPDPYPALCRMR